MCEKQASQPRLFFSIIDFRMPITFALELYLSVIQRWIMTTTKNHVGKEKKTYKTHLRRSKDPLHHNYDENIEF